MKNIARLIGISLAAAALLSACDNEGDQRMAEKARLEGREAAEAELEAQLAAKNELIERARQEGKAQAEAGLNVQLDNREVLLKKAREEGRAIAEQEIEAETEKLAQRARAMESDLARRQRFYQALSGVYEGDLSTEDGAFKIKITFVPTVSPFDPGRVRLPEEIAQDLNALSFGVQVVEWNPQNPKSGVGCRIENVRPDLIRGTVSIAKEGCGSVYALSVSESSTISSAKKRKSGDLATSKGISAAILSGKADTVTALSGVKRPTTNAQEYSFKLRKRGE